MNLHEYCKFSPSDENVKDVNSTSLAHAPLCCGLFALILVKNYEVFLLPKPNNWRQLYQTISRVFYHLKPIIDPHLHKNNSSVF